MEATHKTIIVSRQTLADRDNRRFDETGCKADHYTFEDVMKSVGIKVSWLKSIGSKDVQTTTNEDGSVTITYISNPENAKYNSRLIY